MAMHRILVDMPKETIEKIEELAKRSKMSRAQWLRHAADELLKREASDSWNDAFGKFKATFKGDATAYQRSLRDEWS